MVLNGRLTDVQADGRSLIPRLQFGIEYENRSTHQINVFTVTGRFLLKVNGSDKTLGTLSPSVNMISISPKERVVATLYYELNNHTIGIVEEFRKGGDVKFKLDTQVLYETEENGKKKLASSTIPVQAASAVRTENLEIPQSKWVKMLQGMGHARFRVIELPMPEPPKGTVIGKSLKHLEKALESFYEGDYDDVLVKCRMAIEEINKKLTKEKLEGVLKSASKAEKMSAIQAKVKSFASLGPHIDTKVDQRDAEMALHCTMSLIRYLARNLIKSS